MDLAFHEATNLFPLMEGEEFEQLKADIKANGQRLPILTFKGKIIDGRNRYRACKELGINPWLQDAMVAPQSGVVRGVPSPVECVVSLNLHRRHLTPEQKREVIAAL